MLAWAAREQRVVLTHDVSTMMPAIRRQTGVASRCAPVVFVPNSLPIGTAVEEILLVDACWLESDWVAGVIYLPLR